MAQLQGEVVEVGVAVVARTQPKSAVALDVYGTFPP